MNERLTSLVPLHDPDWAFDLIDSSCQGCGIKFRDPEDYVPLIRISLGSSRYMHNNPSCAGEAYWTANGSSPEFAKHAYEMWQCMKQEV
jgi:hypothetical protein